MKKIIVLTGSPRKNGNSERLAAAFIEGAKEAGHQVTSFSIRDMKVNGCLGCDYCTRNDGRCIQKDDMVTIYEALNEADVVVFASPVYYFGFSAQLKAIIDRFYASGTKPYPITATALLLTLGGEAKTDATAAIATYQSICNYMQWQYRGMVIADQIMDKGAIEGHSSLAEARELGRNI